MPTARKRPMDERQFSALFDLHFAEVWRFARRRCVGTDEADDAAAEAFAVAWRRRDDLPPTDDVRLWLLGTTRRVLANQRRSAGRRDRLRHRIEVATVALPPGPDPADVIADRDADPLPAALAGLSDDDRELLVMRAWDGLAVTDIARLLDVTPNAVSVRLHKARTRLSALLDGTDAASPRTRSRRSHDSEGGASFPNPTRFSTGWPRSIRRGPTGCPHRDQTVMPRSWSERCDHHPQPTPATPRKASRPPAPGRAVRPGAVPVLVLSAS